MHKKKFSPMVAPAFDEPNNRSHPVQVLRASVQVKRKPAHYRYAIYFPLSIITAMEIGSYHFPLDDFQTRFSITVSLTLTLSAYKTTVNQYLPRLDKPTNCDVWVIASFCLLGSAALEQIVAANIAAQYPSQAEPGSVLRQFDSYAKIVLAAVFIFVYSGLYSVIGRCCSNLTSCCNKSRQEERAPTRDASKQAQEPEATGPSDSSATDYRTCSLV